MTTRTEATANRASDWPAGQVGNVSMSPRDPVPAGEYASWTFRYIAGPYGVDDGGTLLFLLPSVSDRGIPQFVDSTAENYSTVRTSGEAVVTPRLGMKLYERPWSSGLAVDVSDGPLAPGDIVELIVGNRSQGSPGARTQSYAEAATRVRVMVDPFATGVYYDVPGATAHPVIAGRAHSLVAIADSESVAGRDVRLSVRAIDRYGNVARSYRGTVAISLGGVEVASHQFGIEDKGAFVTGVRTPSSGVQRITVTDAGDSWCVHSNPIVVLAESCRQVRLVWGDTQGQTGETVGSGTVWEFLDYARDVARLDFVTHSANDFQVETGFYASMWEAMDKYTVDGEFIAFGGFEWSGNTPVGGDHNVLYADHANAPLMRSSHALVSDRSDVSTDRATVTALNQTLRNEALNGICVAHVGGRVANLSLVEPDTTPVLEIVSVHGWFEWLALEALQAGLEVGFIGASDDHSGRPGASYPTQPAFGVRSGLAAVRTDELSRTGILEALRARHCYATTGERIYLDVTSGEHVMGDKWESADAPTIDVSVAGTAGIEAIDLMGPWGPLQTWRPGIAESRRKLRVTWQGARHRYRDRTQRWDGQLTVRGADILGAESWNFDDPEQGITVQERSRVEWVSSTNGDSDGVILDLDAEPSEITLVSGDVELQVPVASLPRGGLNLPIGGGLDRRVTVSWLPEDPLPLDATTTFVVESAAMGVNVYFVRVRQADGHMAWSSPMFVSLLTE